MIRWNCRIGNTGYHFRKLRGSVQYYNQNARAEKQLNIATLLRSSRDEPIKRPHRITVHGFIRSIRKQKHVAFAALDDGSSLEALQAVFKPEQAAELSNGCAVRIIGTWQKHPSGKEQVHELQVETVEQLGSNDAKAYPIQKKYHTPEYLRTLPHLRTRIPHNSVLLRLRSQVIARVSTFFAEHGFVQTHPPMITSSDCEGAGEVFSVSTATQRRLASETEVSGKGHVREEFFKSPKYMTVSSQLHLEALAQSLGKVWTLSPTFRAERSDTARHLSEFYMLEAEICFIEGLDEIMDVTENLLRDVARYLRASDIGKELLATYEQRSKIEDGGTSSLSHRCLAARWDAMADNSWPRITYAQAIETLQRAASRNEVQFEFPPIAETGLQAEHERYLAETVGKQGPVFITDYPRAQKPFYMAPSSNLFQDSEGTRTAACFDLLFPEVCEVVGGSVREHRYDQLLEAMRQNGLIENRTRHPPLQDRNVGTDKNFQPAQQSSALDWYLDLRRFGSVPHGGFGIGFDRLLGYLAGVSNIRDIVTFPRWYGRCEC